MNRPQLAAVGGLLAAGAVLAVAILRIEPGAGAAADDDDTHVEPPRVAVAGATRSADAPIALSDEQIRASGIALEAARPGRIVDVLTLPGEIRLNEDRTAHVAARVAGVVEAVPAALGQRVRRGEPMAVIASAAVSGQRSALAAAQRRAELARGRFERERQLWEERISAEQEFLEARTALQEAQIALDSARQSLAALGAAPDAAAGNRFTLRAPFDGVVIEKHIALGEAVRDDARVFTVADLSTVWADFGVPAGSLDAVRVGERATVRAPGSDTEVRGTVSYVGALLGEQTRTATARVVLDNPRQAWRPGLFVSVSVASGERQAAVTVPNDAIQTVDGRAHVFVRAAGGFVPRPIETGASDGARTEVRAGLAAGDVVAAAGSYLVRSELDKRAAGQAD